MEVIAPIACIFFLSDNSKLLKCSLYCNFIEKWTIENFQLKIKQNGLLKKYLNDITYRANENEEKKKSQGNSQFIFHVFQLFDSFEYHDSSFNGFWSFEITKQKKANTNNGISGIDIYRECDFPVDEFYIPFQWVYLFKKIDKMRERKIEFSSNNFVSKIFSFVCIINEMRTFLHM